MDNEYIRALIPIGNAGFMLPELHFESADLSLHRGLAQECYEGIARHLGSTAAELHLNSGNTLELKIKFKTTGDFPTLLSYHSHALQKMGDIVNLMALSDLRRLFNHTTSLMYGLHADSLIACVTIDKHGNKHTRGIARPQVICCKHVGEVHDMDTNTQCSLFNKVLRHYSVLHNCNEPKTLIAFAMSRTCFSISPRNSVQAAARLNLLISALESLLIDPEEHNHIWCDEITKRLQILIGDVQCSKLEYMRTVKSIRNDAAHRAGRDKTGSFNIDGKTLTTVENWLRWAILAKLS